ncbi:MAG: biopolymer transporter ExbD [Candidatus Koribacter versatilis]|uniref:Biopolymer transporter ExbD n=1 Tax=Candidatus Korobacter versatilis TaxID=658062 RepID=A0A932EP40_9BACT|nr:biopolymer transporter ExbD [Candidatus Koribacter versatilis]
MGTGQNGPELNVTPFIDILLVLLIIFIVVATSMGSKGEQALIPQPATESTPPPPGVRTIVIRLLPAADGGRPELRINEDPVTWEALRAELLRIYAARVEKVAFIQADKDLDFEYVAQVIDAAHSVNIDKVGLIQPDAIAHSE